MHVALLRGINVTGHNKLKMADLRELFEDLGHEDVSTILQSGNVVFRPHGPKKQVAPDLEAAIKKRLGLDVRVILRTQAELVQLAGENPYLKRGADPAKLHVTFFARKPPKRLKLALDPEQFAPDVFVWGEREAFLHCPNGYGRTKINNAYFERKCDAPATTRSWKTVMRLVEHEG